MHQYTREKLRNPSVVKLKKMISLLGLDELRLGPVGRDLFGL